MTFDFPTWISIAFIGYSATLPLARMIMLESKPTIDNALTILLGLLSIFITATLEGSMKYVSFLASICITAYIYKVEIIGPIPAAVNMRGKTVIVTGANSGIGFETARQLAAMGATVIMGCRSLERSKPMMDSINDSLKNVKGAGKALLLSASLDLNNLSSVRKWVQCLIESHHTSIDVLVCNAGLFIQHLRSHTEVYTLNGKKETIELEDSFVSNHLGHHLLMHLLLPYLHTAAKQRQDTTTIQGNSGTKNPQGELEWQSTDPSRIILVSSSLHKLASKDQGRVQFLQWDKGNTKDAYNQWTVYGATKLAEMLSAKYFQHLLETSTDPTMKSYKNSIYITTLHPGNPVTGVTANLPYALRLLETVFYPFMYLYRQTWQLGAFNTVWCASAPETISYGMNQYFIHMQPSQQNPAVYNMDAAKQVYEFSEMVCRE